MAFYSPPVCQSCERLHQLVAIYPLLKLKGMKGVGEDDNFQMHEGFGITPGDALMHHAIALQQDICENVVSEEP